MICWPVEQSVQTPVDEHEPEQVFPHAPQLLVVVRLVSQPLPGALSQSANIPVHAVTTQLPERQPAVALESVQAFPHEPQFAGS